MPPIIYGKRLRSENNKSKTQDSIPSKPKRKLKLKGDNYVKEYCVYRDEDYGKIDSLLNLVVHLIIQLNFDHFRNN